MKLGELIAIARELKGWSQRELAAKSGVSNAIISQMETGFIKSPSFIKVVKIAKALNLSLDRLAKLEEEDALDGREHNEMPERAG
jgi:transcriptional regulator with XRE-family HTH domain